ncbi:MAG: hypothetical protein RBU27_10645 [Bacteroidota bacterium]|jgi:hypothetical protein|nr:hypothetical protein [Bacteroidota bacterium]
MRSKVSKYPVFLRLLRMRAAGALAVIYTVAAVLCASVPLLGTLGYESALLFGLLAAWIGAVLPFSALRRFRRLDAIASARAASGRGAFEGRAVMRAVLARWLHVTLAGWLLLLLPMAVLTVNALRVPNCAMFDGVMFWLLIPLPTAAFVAAVLLFLDAMVGRAAGWTYFLLLVSLLLQPFVQIFTRPQIFAYNHVFGMFPGLSWDQSQPPFATLGLYRLSTLSYILLLLVTTTALRARHLVMAIPLAMAIPRTRLALAFAVPLAAVLTFHLASDHLGFTNSSAHLRAELGAEYRLGTIRLVYDPATLTRDDARAIVEEHRFQLDRVRAELGVRWENEIVSYLYPDAATKRRLLGTESSDLARPWRGEIHLSLGSWRETVKHELVHVVAGAFGPHLVKAPFVRVLGLTEGLAMAVEWSWGNRTLHESAAGMLAQGLLPHARDCLGTVGFVTGNSSRGYVASGSLTRWLLDSLGVGTIRRAYAADDVEGTLGIAYDEIDRRWRRFLSTIPRERPDSLAIAYSFRRPSLFSATCPRVITERNRDAADALRRGQPRRALALYRDAERLAPNARSAFGIVAALSDLRRWDSVVAMTDRSLSDTARAFSLFPMLLWKGVAAWKRGDSAAADHALSRLIHERLPGWTHGYAERLRRVLRRGARGELAALVTDQLLRNTPRADSVRRARLTLLCARDPDDPVVVEEYMRAMIADTAARTEGRRRALRAFERIAWQPLWYDLRMLAVRLFAREQRWEDAQRLLRHQLGEARTAVQRAEVTEWMARCAMARRKPEARR